jgi:hypothetical protein
MINTPWSRNRDLDPERVGEKSVNSHRPQLTGKIFQSTVPEERDGLQFKLLFHFIGAFKFPI